MAASPQNAELIEMLRTQQAVAGETPEENRRLFDEGGMQASMPDTVQRETVMANGVSCEWFRVPAAAQGAILYLHGGGFMIGSTVSHQAVIARIAEASGYDVLGVNYRLAPEHPFPAGLNDCVSAYRYLLDQGIEARHIAVAGDSAGGALVIATLVSIRDQGLPMAGCGVALSSWADLTLTADSLRRNAERDPAVTVEILQAMAGAYTSGHDAADPLVSPVRADLTGLPPLLLQVGDRDLCEDDSRRLAENARAAGVEVQLELWPEMIHAWHAYYDMLPEARDAIGKIGGYLRTQLAA